MAPRAKARGGPLPVASGHPPTIRTDALPSPAQPLPPFRTLSPPGNPLIERRLDATRQDRSLAGALSTSAGSRLPGFQKFRGDFSSREGSELRATPSLRGALSASWRPDVSNGGPAKPRVSLARLGPVDLPSQPTDSHSSANPLLQEKGLRYHT